MFALSGGTGSWKVYAGRRTRSDSCSCTNGEAAAFMATGYAKSTGRLGACPATSGPRAINLLNGSYDAKLDHAPLLAITGMQETQILGTGYRQEVALEKLG
jgi:pyruvate dehydrogenase (quinone)